MILERVKFIMLEKTIGQPLLFAVGINHKTASVEVREKLYIHPEEMSAFLGKLAETLAECMVLSTCNRTEIYGVLNSSEFSLDYYKNLIIEFKQADEIVNKNHFFSFVSCVACQQLFKVASSIDSQTVGDDQILQQLRNAYKLAKDNKFTGKILNQLAQRAFKVGKKTYTETAIHKGAVSISLAAVETTVEVLGSLENKSVLIIGAGETARLTAECLVKRQVGKIYLTNRTRASADELLFNLRQTEKIVGEVIEFADFKKILGQMDIIISSTSSANYILGESDFDNLTRKTLVIDIAVPRNVEPQSAGNKNVVLKNIDDLSLIIDRNFECRMAEIPLVNRIIAKEMGDFLMWYYALPLLPQFGGKKGKPETAMVEELREIKAFLAKHISLFHKLARQSKGTAEDDLQIHADLVRQLYILKNLSKEEIAVEK